MFGFVNVLPTPTGTLYETMTVITGFQFLYFHSASGKPSFDQVDNVKVKVWYWRCESGN